MAGQNNKNDVPFYKKNTLKKLCKKEESTERKTSVDAHENFTLLCAVCI